MFKTKLLDCCFYDSMVDLLRETVIMIFINYTNINYLTYLQIGRDSLQH